MFAQACLVCHLMICHEFILKFSTATQAEYDTIKDIILDLLGWGVPVEDLVGSDLSKEVIYYVFHKLNLQLPDTFDATGILPYTPETFSTMSYPAMIPPTTLPGMRPSDEPDSPTPFAVATSASTLNDPFNVDHQDMDCRRWEELMARKANVQPSPESESSIETLMVMGMVQLESSSMETEDAVMASETVEDFLKSPTPVTNFEPPPIALTSAPTSILYTNDVDHNTVITFPSDFESQSHLPDSIIPTSATSTDSKPQEAFPPTEALPPSVGTWFIYYYLFIRLRFKFRAFHFIGCSISP